MTALDLSLFMARNSSVCPFIISHYMPASMAIEALLSPAIAGVGAALSIILYFVISPLLSPLSKVPAAHWSSGYSPIWILWTRWRGKELSAVYEAHQRLGPLVRLGPKDLSVACYDEGIRKIYGGGFDKPGYYDFFRYYGYAPLYCSASSWWDRDEKAYGRIGRRIRSAV